MGSGGDHDLASCLDLVNDCLRAFAAAATSDALSALMEQVSSYLGFRYYALIHHVDPDSEYARVDIKHYPAAVADRLLVQGLWRRDPVMRACSFAGGAFVWSDLPRIIHIDRRDEASLAFGADAGLNEGITVPYQIIGQPIGSCTFAGISRPEVVDRLLGVVQMIGVFAFHAARRITAEASAPVSQPRLHPKPRQCVTLAGLGLSNKEIARALAITPRTVDGYLTQARHLLGAPDRASLVASAMIAGEIGLNELVRRQPE